MNKQHLELLKRFPRLGEGLRRTVEWYKALSARSDMRKYCADHIAAYQRLEIS